MKIPVAVLAARQFRALEILRAVFAMHADRLFLDDVVMASGAVDRFEPATVPSIIGAQMAFEALSLAVRRDREVGKFIVAFDAVAICICCTHWRDEKHTGNEESEEDPHVRLRGDFGGIGRV